MGFWLVFRYVGSVTLGFCGPRIDAAQTSHPPAPPSCESSNSTRKEMKTKGSKDPRSDADARSIKERIASFFGTVQDSNLALLVRAIRSFGKHVICHSIPGIMNPDKEEDERRTRDEKQSRACI